MLWKPLISFSWWLSWFCRTFWGGSGAMRTPGGTKLRVCVGVEREVWDQRGVPSVSIKQSKAKAAPGQSSTLPTTSIKNLLVPTSLVNRGAYKKKRGQNFLNRTLHAINWLLFSLKKLQNISDETISRLALVSTTCLLFLKLDEIVPGIVLRFSQLLWNIHLLHFKAHALRLFVRVLILSCYLKLKNM